ncbi:hypothetical protein TNCV_2197971 [Trichonephila clavipes]|nr:hypothetical protein TNCV_2197971 [Trichonephila clavipes]
MKTSSVESYPAHLPLYLWERKYRRFVLQPKFSALAGNEGKREIVLNRRPELYRGKYRCVQPKINLLKRCSYAGETQCFPVEPSRMSKRCLHMMEKPFSSGLHGNTAADSVRSDGRSDMQPKATQSRAQAH